MIRSFAPQLHGLHFPAYPPITKYRNRNIVDQETIEIAHQVAKLYGVFDANPYSSGGPNIECLMCRKYKLVEGVTEKGYRLYEGEETQRQWMAFVERAARTQRRQVSPIGPIDEKQAPTPETPPAVELRVEGVSPDGYVFSDVKPLDPGVR